MIGDIANLHLSAIALAEGVTVHQMLTFQYQGEPSLIGLRGTNSEGEGILVIGSEQPIPFTTIRHKAEVEALHVERFRVDCRARGGGEPFTSVRPGLDPPDFFVRAQESSEKEMGLECTRLANGERLSAQAQMDRLERELLAAPRESRSRIAGCVVRVRIFDPATLMGPPFKSGDPRLNEIVELVLSLDPETSQLPDGPFPPQLPPEAAAQTPTGAAGASITSLTPGHRPSPFMRRSGFELVLDFTTTHTTTSVAQTVAEVVEKKDIEVNEILLITAGGPDRLGLIHPGEELVAGLLLDGIADLDLRPSPLRRVVLHRWAAGDAWEIHPTRRRVVAPQAHGAAGVEPPRQGVELAYPRVVIPSSVFGGRNDPCACGSGRKAKHCHLADL
jgi:hypothetical protein